MEYLHQLLKKESMTDDDKDFGHHWFGLNRWPKIALLHLMINEWFDDFKTTKLYVVILYVFAECKWTQKDRFY